MAWRLSAVGALALMGLGVVAWTSTHAWDGRAVVSFGGWMPDGAAADTFWDTSYVDVPGFSMMAMHCHGRVNYELDLGATGPPNNPCVVAMYKRTLGSYSMRSVRLESVWMLPDGDTVYRKSVNGGPWSYCVGRLPWSPNARNASPPNTCGGET